MDSEHLRQNIVIWEKIVEVQMHFNELEMKIRNFAILLITAFLGGAGLALKDGLVVSSLGIPLASLLCFACTFVCAVFYFVDKVWYHPLLKGAVAQGMAIEKYLGPHLPHIKLAHAIGEQSKYQLFGKFVLDSGRKLQLFYASLGGLFIVTGVVLMTSISPAPSEPLPNKEAAIPASAPDALPRRFHAEKRVTSTTTYEESQSARDLAEAEPEPRPHLESEARFLQSDDVQEEGEALD